MTTPPVKTKKLPFLTGFCDVGSHEGTRAKSWSGQPMRTCPFWETCPCECHETITRMFEMAGRERLPQENPEYVPYQRDFWMPSDDPTYRMPDAAPDVVTSEDKLEVTASGRVRKGGLEIAVQKVVLAWLEDADLGTRIVGLAVKDISDRVYENEGAALEKPPSLGAVDAVLKRWDGYGYVLLGHKPTRVIGLTPDGKENGLDWCRARSKKEKQ